MSQSLTYKDAGVDIAAGNTLVENLKQYAKATHQKGVLSHIGGFGALFELPVKDYDAPVLVSCTDGVGTKLMLAIEMNQHDTIGIDCVAMCVNDCVVSGAKPLWFLDYFATGKLSVEQAQSVIAGIAEGCAQTGMSLIGGETAEMPDMYKVGDYDVAGFCVGIVEKSKILDGHNIKAGDLILGLTSSGVHANGFSLVRKIIQQSGMQLNDSFGNSTLGDTLLTPTRLYVRQTLACLEHDLIKGAAHITGGGLLENIPRCLPDDVTAEINQNAWRQPAIFDWLQQHGQIEENEMLKTFNCGIGMCYVISPENLDKTMTILQSQQQEAYVIGKITPYHQSKIRLTRS